MTEPKPLSAWISSSSAASSSSLGMSMSSPSGSMMSSTSKSSKGNPLGWPSKSFSIWASTCSGLGTSASVAAGMLSGAVYPGHLLDSSSQRGGPPISEVPCCCSELINPAKNPCTQCEASMQSL